MEKLKKIIESTLVNNLDIDIHFHGIGTESVLKTSNIIAQEIKDIAINFRNWSNKQIVINFTANQYSNIEELFNQFINDKYKEE